MLASLIRSTRPAILAPIVLTALLAAVPAAAAGRAAKAPEPAGAGEGAKTLAATVRGMDRAAGLLTFHRSAGKLYLEVSPEQLGAPLGFTAVIVQAVGDWIPRDSGDGTSLVTWKRMGHRLALVKKNLDFRADLGAPLRSAVEASFPDSPLFLADLVPLADRPEPLLVDAGGLFGADPIESLASRLAFSARPDEATLVSLQAFPDNVVARVAYRLRRMEKGDGGGERGRPAAFAPEVGRLADRRYLEVTVDYHFFRLPGDDGYRPRPADERIGVFPLSYKDYTDIDRRDTAFRHLAQRWDVRPSDPSQPVSPAVEPITFYVDHAVPAEWRSLVREGALWWNRAFEKAGIRDAVRVLDRPADPAWDPADVHHSMIYWNLTDDLMFSGMAGPSLVDPRTGKVLKATVYLNSEFASFSRHRYLVYSWWRAPEPGGGNAGDIADIAAAGREAMRSLRRNPSFCDRDYSFSSQMAFARLVLQSRGIAAGSPESERFLREGFLELVAHEVGHALGFPHNWKASLVGKAGDVAAGKLTGRAATGLFSTSVMDYDPIYLAPKGTPQGDYFLQEVGPYDELAVEYLYRPFPGVTPEEEARALDAIAARAEVEPGLIYDGGELNAIDPTTNADDFGDDPLAFAEARLALLHQEVLPRLPELVLAEGHDYSMIRQALDAAVFSVAMDYVDMTARQVGGQVLMRRVADSPAAPEGGPMPVTPVAPATQRRALEVLDRQLFADGAFALPPAAMAALKADLLEDWNYPWRYASDYDLAARVAGLYETALRTLFEPARLVRVLDNERRTAGPDRFTLPELFGHLEETAFGGGDRGGPSQDRRSLQRIFVLHMAKLAVTPPKGTPAEASQVAAATLRSINRRLDRALAAKPTAAYARAHYEDLAARIRRTLDAGVEVPAGS